MVDAVLGAGLRLELLSEHDYTLFPRFPDLVEDRELLTAGAVYRQPEGAPAPAAHVLAAGEARVGQRERAVQLGPNPGRRLWAPEPSTFITRIRAPFSLKSWSSPTSLDVV